MAAQKQIFLWCDDETDFYGLHEKINIKGKVVEKKIRTPLGNDLLFPKKKIAQQAKDEHDQPNLRDRFFTQLAMTIIDKTIPQRASQEQYFLSSLHHDTIIFLDGQNRQLADFLTERWQPVWHWAEGFFGAPLPIQAGWVARQEEKILVNKNMENVTHGLAKKIHGWDDWLAGGIFYLAGLLESPLLALYHLHHRVAANKLYDLAFAEQHYQITNWGADEAMLAAQQAMIKEIDKTQQFIAMMMDDHPSS